METTEREYMRFTIQEVNAGRAEGWSFAGGWYPFQSSWWAWFCREVPEHG